MTALLEALKIIMEGESEAKKILEAANIQAEEIKRKAEEKAEEVYKEAYEETIAEAERRSMEMKKRARDDAELEAQSILHHAEEQIKEIQVIARKKFDEAVNAILGEIMS